MWVVIKSYLNTLCSAKAVLILSKIHFLTFKFLKKLQPKSTNESWLYSKSSDFTDHWITLFVFFWFSFIITPTLTFIFPLSIRLPLYGSRPDNRCWRPLFWSWPWWRPWQYAHCQDHVRTAQPIPRHHERIFQNRWRYYQGRDGRRWLGRNVRIKNNQIAAGFFTDSW